MIAGNEIEGVERCKPGGHSDVLQTYLGGQGLTFRNNYLHDNAAGLLIKTDFRTAKSPASGSRTT